MVQQTTTTHVRKHRVTRDHSGVQRMLVGVDDHRLSIARSEMIEYLSADSRNAAGETSRLRSPYAILRDRPTVLGARHAAAPAHDRMVNIHYHLTDTGDDSRQITGVIVGADNAAEPVEGDGTKRWKFVEHHYLGGHRLSTEPQHGVLDCHGGDPIATRNLALACTTQ